MPKPPTILFVHRGRAPFYLRCALESARVFSPASRILLACDRPTDLGRWQIESVPLDGLTSPAHARFRQLYRHISTVDEQYERFCFERWFFLATLWDRFGLDQALYLDSDCLLFTDPTTLFGQVPLPGVSVSGSGSPHCAFLAAHPAPFLEFLLTKFADDQFLARARQRQAEARAAGGLANLTDMTLLELYARETPRGAIYDNILPLGHLDHNLNQLWHFKTSWRFRGGRYPIKRVFWELDHGRLLPYFEEQATGQRVRALVLHFQSGAKRLIRRFNPLPPRPWPPVAWRRAYYNHILFPPYGPGAHPR